MNKLSFQQIQNILIEENLLREVTHQGVWHYQLQENQLLTTNLSNLSYDSKKVTADTLFFCKGTNFKEEYLNEAVQNGISYYVSEKLYNKTEATGFIVSDVKKAMAVIAGAFYDHPQKKLKVIGVTGTKGKTTTVFFLKNILEQATKGRTALISSIHNTVDGKNYVEAELTTPESLDVFRLMAEAVKNGMTHLVMEVSSQAYKLDRVYGIQFDVGVFLNISKDHVGPLEHRDFEDYFYCKRQLLEHSDKIVLYRGTDQYTLLKELSEMKSDTVVVYGDNHPESEYYIEETSTDVSSFEVKSRKEDRFNITGKYKIGLPGDFNKENALSAILVGAMLGASMADCQKGVEKTKVPGRMEIFTQSNGSKVYVDYAHNYISIKRLLEFVRNEHPEGRVIALLGSPGGKGTSRRKDFGEVLSAHADLSILTSDDPNFDDPEDIAKEIASYMEEDAERQIIGDRIAAIEHALTIAEPKDAVVIAGKGDHTHQIIDGEWVPYEGDDVLTARFIRDGKLQ